MEKSLFHVAQRALQRQRRGRAAEPADVLPGVHVQQPAASRQAEPATGEAEDLLVLILRSAPKPPWTILP